MLMQNATPNQIKLILNFCQGSKRDYILKVLASEQSLIYSKVYSIVESSGRRNKWWKWVDAPLKKKKNS